MYQLALLNAGPRNSLMKSTWGGRCVGTDCLHIYSMSSPDHRSHNPCAVSMTFAGCRSKSLQRHVYTMSSLTQNKCRRPARRHFWTRHPSGTLTRNLQQLHMLVHAVVWSSTRGCVPLHRKDTWRIRQAIEFTTYTVRLNSLPLSQSGE